MDEIELWHNPRCSKSRAARAILEAAGVPIRIRAYLDDPPTRAELEQLLEKLGLRDPSDMMRRKEDAFTARRLAEANRDTLIAAMIEAPILIERPIAVRADRAVIARPPERVRELLD